MAKSSRPTNTGTRVVQTTLTPLRSRSFSGNLLIGLEDNRRFDPWPDFPSARTLDGGTASVTANQTPQTTKKGRSRVPYQIAFSAPAETLVCIRRQTRKQVLFAKNKTGKSGQRKARWSKWSSTKC